MLMVNNPGNERNLIISYLTLRKLIGFLGAGLPFVLGLGALLFFQTNIQSSMSAYYYTGMRNVFVGTLFVIGFFLLSYRGYERADDIAGDLGCVFALGIALFPTATEVHASSYAWVITYVHYAFAALFFLTLIYFSMVLFTKTKPDQPPTRRKRQRNKVYKACGYTMAMCIVLIAVYNLLPGNPPPLVKLNPIFWLESFAIVAFGVSWLIKGEALLGD